MKVYCVFWLESPHRGNSNDYTQNTCTIFNIKKKITQNYPKSAAMNFFWKGLEQVRNSSGKQANSVPATEGLLYFDQYVFALPQLLQYLTLF